jgi:glycosyltransferase involved in cell wall biosynthesis
MRVALDGLPLQVRSAGIAVYTRELIGALAALPDAPQLQLFTCAGLPAPGASAARARRSTLYPLIMGAPLHGLPRLFSLAAALGEIDLFHATNYSVPRTNLPLVLTVHDLALLRHPELGTPALRRMVGRVADAWPTARRVIADSAATAHDLHELLGVPLARVRIVYPGCTAQFRAARDAADAAVLARYQLAEPYVLHVGTFEPRKNLVRLVYAYARATAERRDPPLLVLVGGAGWGDGDPSAAIAATDCAARVRRLHTVPTEDLPALYRGAQLFAYPSLYEGFGLPVLEALACGAPVVTSTASSLPEVAGDAALLVDPRDEAALADALSRLLDDDGLRRELAARGPARAAPFTWTRCAAETLAVYREALND